MKILREGGRGETRISVVIGAPYHLEARNRVSYDYSPTKVGACVIAVCLMYGPIERIPEFHQANKFLGCRAGISFFKPYYGRRVRWSAIGRRPR
jgi:hypothetical protein